MPNKMLFTNNAATTLASSINNIVTSLTVATGTGALFPTLSAGQYFYCTLANTAGTVEIIKVTARSGDTFSTIVRAQDGTSATSWNSGDKVELRLVNADLINFPQLDSDNTFAGTNTFSTTITGDISGNAGTATTVASTLAVNKGGTGQTSYTDGELLIGNTTGNTLAKGTLTAGTGISVTNGPGAAITIASTVTSGQLQTELFTAPGTWTKPASCTQVKVTVVGGGGGGGGFSAYGGMGGVGIAIVPVSAPVTITVGTGGAASPSPTGASGGTSSFGPAVSATGGTGSTPSPAPAAPGSGTVSVGTSLRTFSSTTDGTKSNVIFSNGGLFFGGFRDSGVPGLNAAIAYSTTSNNHAGTGGEGWPSATPAFRAGGVGGAILVEYIG
jgi:hypothetical protein